MDCRVEVLFKRNSIQILIKNKLNYSKIHSFIHSKLKIKIAYEVNRHLYSD